MTISTISLIDSIAQQLNTTYSNTTLSHQYAWWMLEAILGKKKTILLTQETIELSLEQEDTITQWIEKQIEDYMPLQYLIGKVPFASCEIKVEPPILIPRQETEEWCENLIAQLKKIGKHPLRILDLCTGSGCIALSLAKELPHAKIYAVDISKQALVLAQKNAYYNAIKNVTFLPSDLFKNISTNLTFDLIISNPPYISVTEWKQIDASVKEWEDPLALLAPEEGLGIIHQIIKDAPRFLNPHSILRQHDVAQLIIEMGYLQGEQVKAAFEKEGFCSVTIHKDLQGNDRIVVGCVQDERSSQF